jgi:hypothetical protein
MHSADVDAWGLVELRILMAGAVLSFVLAGCAADDPMSRAGACFVGLDHGGGEPAAQVLECDLGKRTNLVVLPRNAQVSELKRLGVPNEILSVVEPSGQTGPMVCSLATKPGELPSQVRCFESSLEIDRPEVIEADVIKVHMERKQGGKPRVTDVEGIRR